MFGVWRLQVAGRGETARGFNIELKQVFGRALPIVTA
jgi:hypothetical protein